MIFVTVGTHEQPFNRLIRCIDKLVCENVITEEVVIQSGYSTYKPQYCKWSKAFSYREMEKNVHRAHIVITHGGPASLIMPLQIGKIPIVVPRRHDFGEHVNNHQVDFCNAVSKRMGTIIVVADTNKLGEAIQNYEAVTIGMDGNLKSNNCFFNKEFGRIIDEMFRKKSDKHRKLKGN